MTDLEETTGMVSSSLNMSARELLDALVRLREENADDPQYQELRFHLPPEWPI